ncbi:MAG TPA: alpha/beta fold hydrolase [Gemmatimonadaceae bacterium]|nr:alpha/beta fold hydrolase [Gemmatimonadaceae bacterium]
MTQPGPTLSTDERAVRIPIGRVTLEGDLIVPAHPRAVVLFAHGSGSSRFSARNKHVAAQLREHGFGTLLIDLLTPNEDAIDERTAEYRFDIARLAERLVGAVDWLRTEPATSTLPVAIFGASTGGGAALVAAAERPDRVAAVVSRGGRPDLAGAALGRVPSPTLLIVGGNDEQVLELNRAALTQLRATTRLDVVPGATHLFEEPGALDEVARLAAEWIETYASRAT